MVETAALLVNHVLFIDGSFLLKCNGQLRFHRVNALDEQRAQRVASYDLPACCPIPGRSRAPCKAWLARDEQCDHVELALE